MPASSITCCWLRLRAMPCMSCSIYEQSTPSVAEKAAAHELTHVPFRSWCRYCCVQGPRSTLIERSMGQTLETAQARSQDDADMLKFATMRWRQAGARATFYVRRRDKHVLKGTLNAMDEWGLTDLIFKSDRCVQLATAVAQTRQHRSIVRATPKGSKGSLGAC